jgi:rhodanese-related sulfurtransferase/protein-L-isoaspartate O-methyltransferase
MNSVEQRWNEVADIADRFSMLLGDVNEKLLELGKLFPGCLVLDLGCGTGELARRAAERVGDDGKVIAVDVASSMIESARHRHAAPNLTFHVRDAHTLELADDVCDVVFTQMSLPFFSDPSRVLKRSYDVLKPAGRFVALTLGNPASNSFFAGNGRDIESYLAAATEFGQEARLAAALSNAKFEDVKTRTLRAVVRVGDVDSHWSAVRGALGIPRSVAPPSDVRPGATLSVEVVLALALKPDPADPKPAPIVSFEQSVARARGAIRELTPREVDRHLRSQNPRYLDVREPEEWAQGWVKGAVRIPRGDLEDRITAEITDRGATIVTYCQDGNIGALAAARLGAMGYTGVWNLAGGMKAWTQAKMAVEKAR